MMKLHVFNPEHDLALAANLRNFTAPHAGRQLRADLGFIPALWAEADDVVLVEHADEAERKFRLLTHRPFMRFITKEQLGNLRISDVDVWGGILPSVPFSFVMASTRRYCLPKVRLARSASSPIVSMR